MAAIVPLNVLPSVELTDDAVAVSEASATVVALAT